MLTFKDIIDKINLVASRQVMRDEGIIVETRYLPVKCKVFIIFDEYDMGEHKPPHCNICAFGVVNSISHFTWNGAKAGYEEIRLLGRFQATDPDLNSSNAALILTSTDEISEFGIELIEDD